MNPEIEESLTPAMQQYFDIKKQYHDAILFFRMGDFYEMFEEDAKIAHKVLGISITSRNKNAKNPILLAGIPYHAKEKYLPLLIQAGYKVAIAEQISDPKLKGIVQREVVRVVTPATLSLENEGYDPGDTSTTIVALVYTSGIYGLAMLNLSTHQFECCEYKTFEACTGDLYKINPSEAILERDIFGDENIQEVLGKKYGLNIYYSSLEKDAYRVLCSTFGVKNLEGFGIEQKHAGQRAAALLLEYLISHQKHDFSFIKNLTYKQNDIYLGLDEATIRSLDLVFNLATKSHREGTLLGALNETKTAMGKRFLRNEMLHPLQDRTTIEKRQRAIALLLEDSLLLESLRKELSFITDMDAIITRLSLGRVTPRDLLALKRSLISIKEVLSLIETSQNKELIELLHL